MGMEKRIYAVVAEKVDTPLRGEVRQIPGRMSAQCTHAVRRMSMHMMLDHIKKLRRYRIEDLRSFADQGITTLHLQCRDSKELNHVDNLLHKAGIKTYGFMDTNFAVYGDGEVRTAIATEPVSKEQVEGILDYLPLFLSTFPQNDL